MKTVSRSRAALETVMSTLVTVGAAACSGGDFGVSSQAIPSVDDNACDPAIDSDCVQDARGRWRRRSPSAQSQSAGNDASTSPSLPEDSGATAPSIPSDDGGAVVTTPNDSIYGYRGTPGYPAGTVLKEMATSYLTITQDNTVLDGVYIRGGVHILANNVTIKNSRIDGPGGNDQPVIRASGRNASILNNQLGNSANVLSGHYGIAFDGTGVNKAVGNNILHTHGGILFWASNTDRVSDGYLIQDNWVHQMMALPGDHMNVITSECAANVVVDHNTLEGTVAPNSLQADIAFTLTVYSDDQGCSVIKASPFTSADGQKAGGLENLTYTNNAGLVHGSYGLFLLDLIGSALIANNLESDDGYGPIADPRYLKRAPSGSQSVPPSGSWRSFGNVDQTKKLYPAGTMNTQ